MIEIGQGREADTEDSASKRGYIMSARVPYPDDTACKRSMGARLGTAKPFGIATI
jgi:hypothetical protein